MHEHVYAVSSWPYEFVNVFTHSSLARYLGMCAAIIYAFIYIHIHTHTDTTYTVYIHVHTCMHSHTDAHGRAYTC
jgi:hypothetical protein